MWNLTVFSCPAKEKLNVMNNVLDLVRRSEYAYHTEANDFSAIFDWVSFAQSSVYIKRKCGMIANETTLHRRQK